MKGAEAKRLLLQLGIRPRKAEGQHFLIDQEVIRRQVEHAKIRTGSKVLEIGPGLGFLTAELLSTGAKVVAIESDHKFCEFLRAEFGDSLKLLEGDATRIELPEFDKVVSNLPYQISSEITFRILERRFELAVLMYQREFAERLVAGEASAVYGRLSVMAAYRADCEILEIVRKRAFWPVPRVDSALVMIRSRLPKFQPKNEKLFVDVVRVLFSHRRKMISNALIAGADLLDFSREELRQLIPDIPFADERVELLTPEEIGEIGDFLWEAKKLRSITSADQI